MITEPLSFQLSVAVQNTGETWAGSEVVQAYLEAPQGALGKPSRVLVAFGKTHLLQPGEREIINLAIPGERLTSWDDSGDSGHPHCWLLEAGGYRLFVGNSVRDLQPVCFAGREVLIVPSVQVYSRHAFGGSTYFFYSYYSYYSYILFFMCFVFIIFLVII